MKSSLCEFRLRQRAAVLLGAVLLSLASGCHKTDASATEFFTATGNGNLAKVACYSTVIQTLYSARTGTAPPLSIPPRFMTTWKSPSCY